MSEQISLEITKQIGSLLNTLVWPAFILLVVARFHTAIEHFFTRITELIFKGAGLEFSAKIAQEIGANLGAAEATKQAIGSASSEPAAQTHLDTSTIQTALRQASSPAVSQRLRVANLLWVDDKPSNNFYEMESLKRLGITIDTAKSTQEADSFLNRRRYDLIITDLKRGSDPDAGLDFLKSVLARRPDQKVIIYTSYQVDQKKGKALAAGAKGITNSPSELFQMVVNELQ